MDHDFPRQLQGLLSPAAYPHPVEAVHLIATHISWVLLTGEFAYKIKRPVRFPFVDLRSAERRAFLCREELRLNRRFAPELYLEVCPISVVDGAARLGAGAEVIEQAVKMRQFPGDEQLHRLLQEKRVDPAALRSFGRDLALVHDTLPSAAMAQEWGQPAAAGALMLENLEEWVRASAVAWGEEPEASELRQSLLAHVESSAACMMHRFAGGRVRECHGDLHTGNLVRLSRGLVAFDCLEFDPALRWIDVADEVAFLLADLEASHAPLHAHAFLGGYLEQSGDYPACRLLDLYKAHRSLVRAKVLALSSAQPASANATERLSRRRQYLSHVSRARAALQAKRPQLILMAGISGSGKSWLAERIAPSLEAVHLRSDVERKRLAGIPGQERSHSGLDAGTYAPHMVEAVYEHLVRCAREVIEGGLTAIVDATFQRQADRARFSSLSAELGVRATLIHCHAPQSILERRIAERARRGADPSEADLAVMRSQLAHFEPVAATEPLTLLDAPMEDPRILEQILPALRSSPSP